MWIIAAYIFAILSKKVSLNSMVCIKFDNTLSNVSANYNLIISNTSTSEYSIL